MHIWEEIVTTALVGTERQALPAALVDERLTALLARLDPADREGYLLRANAVLTCCRRAGFPLRRDDEGLPAAAQEADLPRCRVDAAHDLALMLQGEFRELLPDWLSAVAAQGQRVPEEYLVELLEAGRKQQNLRAAILPVLGERGRWLACQNPDWDYALQRSLFAPGAEENTEMDPTRIEAIWQTGTREERTVLLASLRRSDPARARELVASTWREDTPEERTTFLNAFEIGLSMQDEPLLENALDDRRKEVRSEAQRLLTLLPESRLCLRMIERARSLLTLSQRPLRPANIQVTLPEVCDKAMIRDGIDPKPPASTGEKTWWLIQILGLVPLSLWQQSFNTTPAAILAANRSAEWRDALLEGWTRAAGRQQNAEWADLLLNAWIDHKGGKYPPNSIRWADALPRPRIEAGLLRMLQKNTGPLTSNHPATALLESCRSVWSGALTRAALENIRLNLSRCKGYEKYELANMLERFALFISPECTTEFNALWQQAGEDNPYIKNRIERHTTLVRFRQQMLDKIKGGS